MITDFQNKINQELFDSLSKRGYKFRYDENGYEVSFKGRFIRGAGVMLPREKKLHWRHAIANIRENFNHCVIVASQHQQMMKGTE